MPEELRTKIDKLSASEAKSFLFHTMLRLQMIQESGQPSSKMLDEIIMLQEQLTDSKKTEKPDKGYHTIHVVCGESPAAALRAGFGNGDKVIGLPALLSVGPIYSLHTEAGQRNRFDWLEDHLNIFEDDREVYEKEFSGAVEEIKAIPSDLPIIIWAADNADEQTGLRLLLYLLKGKSNNVSLLDVTKIYQELFNSDDYQYFYPRTGEIQADKLNRMYEEGWAKALSEKDRENYQREWETLAKTEGMLRIWEKGSINEVEEDYYDRLIRDTAGKLHINRSGKEFVKAARIIGEVYGQTESSAADAYLEYRLRHLVYSGIFEIKGIPKGMRYYSVKLK